MDYLRPSRREQAGHAPQPLIGEDPFGDGDLFVLRRVRRVARATMAVPRLHGVLKPTIW